MAWRIVFMAFNITPPKSIPNLFGSWLRGVDKQEKAQIRVGSCALLWAIWNICNDHIFNNVKSTSFMQVITQATDWICMWFHLQPMEKRDVVATRSTAWSWLRGIYTSNTTQLAF